MVNLEKASDTKCLRERDNHSDYNYLVVLVAKLADCLELARFDALEDQEQARGLIRESDSYLEWNKQRKYGTNPHYPF